MKHDKQLKDFIIVHYENIDLTDYSDIFTILFMNEANDFNREANEQLFWHWQHMGGQAHILNT